MNMNRSESLETSRGNDREAEFVAALVTYLLRQGLHGSDDIVILTPYAQQLRKLESLLSGSFDVVLDDKDTIELDQRELTQTSLDIDGGNASLVSANLPSSTPASASSKRIRISTVDNFQGEEASVAIISLVRNNPEKSCGFLQTTNRINVLLR